MWFLQTEQNIGSNYLSTSVLCWVGWSQLWQWVGVCWDVVIEHSWLLTAFLPASAIALARLFTACWTRWNSRRSKRRHGETSSSDTFKLESMYAAAWEQSHGSTNTSQLRLALTEMRLRDSAGFPAFIRMTGIESRKRGDATQRMISHFPRHAASRTKEPTKRGSESSKHFR